MSDNSFRSYEGFPDFSLPSRREEEQPNPTVPSRSGDWREGDRVFAPWEPIFLYAGVILRIEFGEALINFDDGDEGWVKVARLQRLHLSSGQKVHCRERSRMTYFPATVCEMDGNHVLVRREETGAETWECVASLRLVSESAGAGAKPTQFASQAAIVKNLVPGDRVLAPWNNTVLFAGTVDQIQDEEAHIHFDDGDHGWVQRYQLLPMEFPVGARVMSRWKMGGNYFPGTVSQVDAGGERLFIVYDDGDKEWTQPAGLAVPCEPFGPNARPTRNATRWIQLRGWILPIVLGILFVMLRSSCR